MQGVLECRSLDQKHKSNTNELKGNFGDFSSHNALLGLLALKKFFVVFIYMLWFPVLCFYIIPLYANGKIIQSHTSFVGPCNSALVIKNKET